VTTTTQKKKKKKKKINRPIKNFSNTVSDSCITMIRKLHHRIEDAGKVVFAKKTTKCIKPAVVLIRDKHTHLHFIKKKSLQSYPTHCGNLFHYSKINQRFSRSARIVVLQRRLSLLLFDRFASESRVIIRIDARALHVRQ
jgi:hypothetical protein